MPRAKQDPQDRAIKVLVAIIKSHQGLVGLVREEYDIRPGTSTMTNLRAADAAFDGAGKLLNDLRLGEVKVTAWEPTDVVWCVECGNNWEGDSYEECPECGGQCSDA